MSIAVVIIEDDQSVMRRLVSVISASSFCEVVGVAKNRGEAVAAILANRADLYVVDIGLPDVDGIDLIRLAVEICPAARSVVLSTFGDSKHVMRALRAGACGYLLKEDIHASMVEKLVSAHNGQAPLSPAVAQLVVERIAQLETRVRPQVDRSKVLRDLGLGPREWEVLHHLIEGLRIVEIGTRLAISPHTVNQHLRSIYRKLGVKSRAMAANAARLHGLTHD